MSGFKSPNHTQVPNDFFDMIADMSEAELRVTLIMIRETRGWHRDAAKVGKQVMADRSGLSFNGVTAGCEAALKRGTFRRTNPDAKTRAEWELITDDEPSASEGVNPQPVREQPSANEGQVRVKESIKKVKDIKEGASAAPKPPTPKEIQLYRAVTKKFPPSPNFEDVVAKIQAVGVRLGRDVTVEDLRPTYSAWTGCGWNQFSINWLEYAIKGTLPMAQRTKQNSTEPRGFDAVRKWAAMQGGEAVNNG